MVVNSSQNTLSNYMLKSSGENTILLRENYPSARLLILHDDLIASFLPCMPDILLIPPLHSLCGHIFPSAPAQSCQDHFLVFLSFSWAIFDKSFKRTTFPVSWQSCCCTIFLLAFMSNRAAVFSFASLEKRLC